MKKILIILILILNFFPIFKIFAKEKNYKISTDLTFAPFEFQNKTGKYIGIDIDILNKISKLQKFKFKLIPSTFENTIQSLKNKNSDAIIAGMSITNERKKIFDFSEPYFNTGIQMAVKKNNNIIKSYKNLKNKNVSAISGTESAFFLEKNQKKFKYIIKIFEDQSELYYALENEEIDAIFDDHIILEYAIKNNKNIKLIENIQTNNSYALAVKKGKNKDLLNNFNIGLKKIKNNGIYHKIIDKYIPNTSELNIKNKNKMKKINSKKNKYIIVSDSTFAPFEFQNINGKYEGIDIALLTKIAKLQNFNLEFRFIGLSSAIQALESGQADGLIAGLTITDERKKSFNFSNPYFTSGIQIAIKKGNDSIKSYYDLKGKTIGAKIGSESATFLEAKKEKYNYNIKYLDTTDALYSSLDIFEIDAMMDDYPVINYGIKQNQPLTTPIPRESGGLYGFAVKKNKNIELLQMFNEGLKKLKSTGEYDKIIKKYIKYKIEDKNKINETNFIGIITNNGKRLINGLIMTILLTLISFVLATLVGLFICLLNISNSNLFKFLTTIYITIIRGIPLMVLAFFIYFGIPGITNINIPVFIAGIITLTLNASAYISELIKGGIFAVPKGQKEAARSLGLTYNKTMFNIILPQAFKIILPSFINQFIISLKDTTILSAIGLIELLQTGKIIVARNLQSTLVYFIIAIIYLSLITLLTKLINFFK